MKQADSAYTLGDEASAFEWYRLAADRTPGDARAMFMVAIMLGKGNAARPASVASSLMYAKKAASAGHAQAAVLR